MAAPRSRHACSFDIHGIAVADAAVSPQQQIRFYASTRLQQQHHIVGTGLEADVFFIVSDHATLFMQVTGERFSNLVIQKRQQSFPGVDQRDLATEVQKYRSVFAADDTEPKMVTAKGLAL